MQRLPHRYRFGDLVVTLDAETVTRGGVPVTLEPKAFRLLVFLIDNRAKLVEKQEILDDVWEGAFVTDNALTRAIAQLRKALGDEAKDAKYIETVPTRGYRFIADVQVVLDAGRPRRPKPVLIAASLMVGVAIWMVASRSTTRRPPAGSISLRPSQVTVSPALDVFPALSPDGTTLAYSSDRSGRFEIYVKQLTPGGNEIQLTSNGEQNLQPTWSPDGTHIAYYAKSRDGIWLVPALGGVARELTDFGSRPAWSPDGETIAFQSHPLTEISLGGVAAMPSSTIWICPWKGGSPRQVTQPGRPGGGHGAPAWSPDGTRIAFASGGYEIPFGAWSVAAQGGAPEKLIDADLFYFELAYDPSNNAIYFTGRQGGLYGLWRASVGSAETPPTLIASVPPASIRHVSMSADGTKLAYTALTMKNSIASVRVARETAEPIGKPIALTEDTGERNNLPAFSPDGNTIAYRHMLQGGHSDIWLMNADGEGAAPVTSGGGYHSPHWLPSGEHLVFSQDRELLKLTLASGRIEPFHTLGTDWGFWTLSPDGKTIAFHADRDGVSNIWTVRAGGKEERQLTHSTAGASFPSWSRDGQHLVLETHDDSDRHIAVIAVGGGDPVQLTNEPGQSWPGGDSWSPDGDKIAFAATRNDVWNVWWVSPSDRTQKQVTDYETHHHYVRYPTWSPSGDQIVYEYSEVAGDIWLVELP